MKMKNVALQLAQVKYAFNLILINIHFDPRN